MDFISEYLFKQGLGYVLFLGALAVCAWLLRLLLNEKDRNAEAMERITNLFTATAKDLINGNANLQKSVDTLIAIINAKK